jgi:hypothetical protein
MNYKEYVAEIEKADTQIIERLIEEIDLDDALTLKETKELTKLAKKKLKTL